MKRLILAIQILLLATLQAVAYEVTVGNKLNKQLTIPVNQSGSTYTIGNGYHACIPHYEEGVLTIPRMTSTEGDQNVIGRFAFRFCTGITKIVVEEGITAIEDFAFIGCSGVTSIELPASLTSVGRGAFVGLPNLKNIVCKSTTAPTWSRADVFSYEGTTESMAEDAQKRILYVPVGASSNYSSYKYDNRVGWADAFKRIYEVNNDPQEISSLAELKAFRNAVNAGENYKNSTNTMVTLTTDIDLSREDWTPIGTEEHPYNGVFNGGGHVIKNLNVNHSSSNYQGLFGLATNATIYNMHLLNPIVAGGDYVGSVVGCVNSDSHITDVLVTSNASGGNDYTVKATSSSGGGIVGCAQSATIERCMFLGQVKCKGWTGGIVGNVNNNVTITDCSASNFLQNFDAVANSCVGGIVGGAGAVNVNRCFARNVISYTGEAPYIGSIVGKTVQNVTSSITNCAYWTGINADIIGTYNAGYAPTLSGNVKYSTESDMNRDKTKSVLGRDNWYYFTENYVDYPVPVTLKDMYINNCVYKTADNGIVYRLAGDASYEIVKYKGNAASVTIPDTYNEKPVTAILPEVFKDNQTMTSVTIGSNITTIGASAFENCDGLTSVSLPNAVTFVGEDAFVDCDELTSFHIGTGFKDHDGNFLAYCPKLTTITVADGNTNGYMSVDNVLIHKVGNYDSYLIACAPGKTGDYEIPISELTNNDVWIMDNCFASCDGLTSITFPKGKYYNLGKAIFDDVSSLRYVDMSKAEFFHVTNGTFYYSSNIHQDVDRNDPDNAFYGLNDHTIVYLPNGNTAADDEHNVFIMNDGNTAATAHYIFLEDDFDFSPKVPVTATGGVRYERDINYVAETEEGYSAQGFTTYLPYAVTLNNENVKVYAPSTIENSTVTFSEVTTKQLTAYTPYFIVAKEDLEIDFSTSTSTEIAAPPTTDPTAIGGYMFKGTTVEIPNAELYDAQKPTYLLQSDGKWHKVPNATTPKAYVGAYRAYFQATDSNNAPALSMVLDDGNTTDIQQIRTIDADGTERYYDMNGRQLNGKPQKGMYIHQGKKYINK